MADSYFVRIRGRTLGPYTRPQIQQMTRKGQVGRSHEVSSDAQFWQPASTFPEIFERPAAGVTTSDAETGDEGFGIPLPAGNGAGLKWHFTQNGVQQSSPVELSHLRMLIVSGQVRPSDQVWNETMTSWESVSHVPDLAIGTGPMLQMQPAWPTADPMAGMPVVSSAGEGASDSNSAFYREFIGKKTLAGVCALLLGNLGIHKFVLGLTSGGVTMLILFFLIVPIPVLTIISLTEAIVYLTKTDEKFFRDYAVDKKQWF
jgi:TM2 domain-containing membrane protein YozV